MENEPITRNSHIITLFFLYKQLGACNFTNTGETREKRRRAKTVDDVKVIALNPDNAMDRLRLCWGHLDDWRKLEIVQKSKKWLEKTNAFFTPTTFIAYKNGMPAGMMEFIPHKSLNKLGLCPCRVDIENNETPERYILGDKFGNHLFISCFLVSKEHQHKGVGKALLNHFLNSEVFKSSDGALVYVTLGNENWAMHIHWPAGPKEFYLKAGFVIEKTLNDPAGYLLSY